MKQFGEMNMDEIRFIKDLNENESLFASRALPFYDWPKKIEIHNKIYELKQLGVLESWMVGDFASTAEYTIVNHDTRPIHKYAQEDEFLSIAKRNFFIKTLENQRSDSLDFHECHVSCIRNTIKESFDLGFFVAIIKNHLLFAVEKEDKSVELFYVDRYDKNNHLRTYPNMKELKRDAKKFDFNFGL
jgi:hypothetical protein